MENSHSSHLHCQLNFDTYLTSACTSTAGRESDEEVIMLASSHPKKPAGRKKFRETRHPVFRGVRKRNSGKWVCEVREPNKKSRIWLGTHQTADMAARAHDVAALALRGRSACLNFADSTWRLPIPASNDVKDIQRAAAEAAEMFGPYQEEEFDVVIEESETLSSPENVSYVNHYTNFDMPDSCNIDHDTIFDMPDSCNIDHDNILDMPELLANLAEGLMLPPPPCDRGNEVEIYYDMSLWSYCL